MAQGFIFARVGAGAPVVATSRGCTIPLAVRSQSASGGAVAYVSADRLVNGDLQVEHIVCDAPWGQGRPVLCLRTYRTAIGGKDIATTVVTALVAAGGGGASEEAVRAEALALNVFANACVAATSREACESLWGSLLNDTAAGRRECGATLLSCTSLSACGLPRAIVDAAVPLAFCFVPPAALDGESLGFLNRIPRIGPHAAAQKTTTASRGAPATTPMPWRHDAALADHIIDALRVCSSFVADSTVSDVDELLQSRYACELGRPAAPSPAAPSPAASSRAGAPPPPPSFVNANDAAQSSFFGRGTWFTGLFAADGAVVCATGGFFRMELCDQILVSTLVGQCGVAATMAPADGVACARYAGNVAGTTAESQSSRTQRAGVQATALPPQLVALETHVQLRLPLAGAGAMTDPVEGSVAVFVVGDNLRFVVAAP